MKTLQEQIASAKINYNAIGTALEPFVGFIVPVYKIGARKIWYRMWINDDEDNGVNMIRSRSKNCFDVIENCFDINEEVTI